MPLGPVLRRVASLFMATVTSCRTAAFAACLSWALAFPTASEQASGSAAAAPMQMVGVSWAHAPVATSSRTGKAAKLVDRRMEANPRDVISLGGNAGAQFLGRTAGSRELTRDVAGLVGLAAESNDEFEDVRAVLFDRARNSCGAQDLRLGKGLHIVQFTVEECDDREARPGDLRRNGRRLSERIEKSVATDGAFACHVVLLESCQ